ncbi:FAD-dependent monooxygenase [Carbonactinospora thermoautotrophica]|uniref:FAD-dependent monooxygenase n=1 Tax=Carbonactinospora thermoautotrophica TaxID=1469144 RepID=UPI000AB0EABF|nr:FAD-dependent monooxygenase [Carbonactinospora thermoautotrophica]
MNTQRRSEPDAPSAPVLVVGAGPVGAILALELAHHGVPSILIDRSLTPSRHPKMDFVNGRSMELLRRLGLSDEIRALGVGPEHPFTFIWTRGFDEPPLTRWHYPSVAGVLEKINKVNDGSMPLEPYQRVLGSLLEDLGRRRTRAHPLIDVREGWTFVRLDQDADGVTAHVVDSTTGTRHSIRTRFLVGCDGANSAVRQALRIPLDSIGPTTRHCDVYFRSGDPALRQHGRFFLTISGRGLTLVSRDEKDTWTGTFPVFDDGPLPADPMAVVQERLGVKFRVDEVIITAEWIGRMAVAESYRRGSVFLAGDAAHQFFPTGGHGANTGLGDAVDLGWKLAAVINGWGGPRLLDSYEAERRPVALFNREMSLNLLEVWHRFPRMTQYGASREHLTGFLEKESYQVDNIGIHFGYRYTSSPVICHEEGSAPRWEWQRIVPSTWPGGRAPSVRLRDGSALFDRFGTGLTLVDLSAENAGKALVEEAQRRGVPMTHLPVDDENVRAVWERDLVLVRPDHHVAWRGNTPPEDWGAVLDRVCGR